MLNGNVFFTSASFTLTVKQCSNAVVDCILTSHSKGGDTTLVIHLLSLWYPWRWRARGEPLNSKQRDKMRMRENVPRCTRRHCCHVTVVKETRTHHNTRCGDDITALLPPPLLLCMCNFSRQPLPPPLFLLLGAHLLSSHLFHPHVHQDFWNITGHLTHYCLLSAKECRAVIYWNIKKNTYIYR